MAMNSSRLEPDQSAIAIAALDEIAEEIRSLEKQWALRRERSRYDAERARRQYDAMEPENRLVARTLEKAWEDKLRVVDEIEQEYRRWSDREPLSYRRRITQRFKNSPRICRPSKPPARRPQTYPALHHAGGGSRPEKGTRPGRHQDSLADRRQTGATSEHQIQRRVQSYDRDYGELELVRERITQLNAARSLRAPPMTGTAQRAASPRI
ncbi:hypothetical protein [Mesorhizobium sp. M0220]|uniref:hypothetical protein n=1 Tax=Mesorhizobium sp. M0220 TaxID=2956920 RepID=UPI00333B7620